MLRTVLKAKLHRATVTGACLDYVGSITIDEALLAAADIYVNEKVLVVNNNNGARFETYAIAGARGSGTVCLNGAAARLGEPGDKVIVMTFGLADDHEAKNFRPTVVFLDDSNKIAGITAAEAD